MKVVNPLFFVKQLRNRHYLTKIHKVGLVWSATLPLIAVYFLFDYHGESIISVLLSIAMIDIHIYTRLYIIALASEDMDRIKGRK